MFETVLIANRGVAATRIARSLSKMGIRSVGLRTAAERDASYFAHFDDVYDMDGNSVADTYLNIEKVLAAAQSSGAEAIHPGYGFLSENAEFARAVGDAGLVFIGPSPQAIADFGLKHRARQLALNSGLKLLPGTALLPDVEQAVEAARTIGYPVIVKSSAGGGGIGMQRCGDENELISAFSAVQALAAANFSSSGVFIEKYLDAPRHVEVQIFGDGQGEVLVLGDRDCSLQRRNQKVVEECPAPNIPPHVRQEIHDAAASLLRSVGYASAGTVEFLYDDESSEAYFLEVNTRLQVEHAVTEMVWQVDIVEWMVRLAAGELNPGSTTVSPAGHAVQVRWYAEDPYLDFKPTPGAVTVSFPDAVRIETWIEGRTEVSHRFDPMLANLICHADTRSGAIGALKRALDNMRVDGIATNRAYLSQALELEPFVCGNPSTQTLQQIDYQPTEVEVISPGLETTLQSYPGRQGYWEVGVPPSGPMDDYSFRLGNRMLGNAETAAGLEILFAGPTLRFRQAADVVVTGGVVALTLDGCHVSGSAPFRVAAGQTLSIGQISEGLRCYLLVRGGFDVREQLRSSATFTLGNMGGHDGRALRVGDVLRWHADAPEPMVGGLTQPDLAERFEIRMLLGPHAAPDFFTNDDMQQIFAATWRVHHNSSRTGVRLVGPQPEWARVDGGEAGLHPSNIHDNAYAFGALDFTGDMPVLLGPDGPSLGGFVCPAVVINADRWKMGQLQAGDAVHLSLVSETAALEASRQQEAHITGMRRDELRPVVADASTRRVDPTDTPILAAFDDNDVQVVVRRAGQEWLLFEFGPMALNIATRLLVHRLMLLLRESDLAGIREMTPGVRSLQIRYDPAVWRSADLIGALREQVNEAVCGSSAGVRSRVVHLPLSWNDPACQAAVDRYVSSVRADAPWCPDNIEFIRRINGLADTQSVKDTVFDASYLVLGLGDVYLGAPVATPLDPRHRLVTTKYNPARTWTAENSVGIGGSYLCVYGMEGPGGYQFVGRTTPVWSADGYAVSEGQNWLLDHFDQIRFHEVDAAELLELRDAARRGAYTPVIENTEFRLTDYENFLSANSASIEQFGTRRTRAFQKEMDRWRAAGLDKFVAEERSPGADDPAQVDVGDGHLIESPIAASVWKVQYKFGQTAVADAEIVLLEAMKSEFSIKTPVAGSVELLVEEGQTIHPGQPIAIVRPH